MTAFQATTQFNATSTGTGNFVVASAVSPFLTPQNNGAISTHVYEYYASNATGTQWEYGSGAWTLGSVTLARTTIDSNSDGTATPVNFLTVPTVIVFPAPLQLEIVIPVEVPVGSLMLFQQTSAPTGWTKQTTHNDKTLRVVSGTASSGGSNAFSTVMAQTVVGSTTLATAAIPSHQHGVPTVSGGCGSSNGIYSQGVSNPSSTFNDNAQGGGGSHNHTITMNIQYVDLIICVKN